MNLIEDLKVLATNCEVAKDYLNLDTETYCIKLIDYEIPSYNCCDSGDINFHPDGRCGCVELDDWYLFGIRCNHLMWATGYPEFSQDEEGLKSDEILDELVNNEVITDEEWDKLTTLPPDILIYGNHKGGLCCKLLTCYVNIDYITKKTRS